MNEEELIKLAAELIKEGLLSIKDIMDYLHDKSNDERYLHLRNTISGKYTTFLQKDVNDQDMEDICQKYSFQLNTDIQLDKENGNPVIRYSIDNKKLPVVYDDLYALSVSRNVQISDILEHYHIPFELENLSCLYREDNSKESGIRSIRYTQKLHIDEKYKDILNNVPELATYLEYIDFSPKKEYDLSISAAMLDKVLSSDEGRPEKADVLLGHRTYISIYDKNSDCIIINGSREDIEPFINEYMPSLKDHIIYAKEKEIFETYLLTIQPEQNATDITDRNIITTSEEQEEEQEISFPDLEDAEHSDELNDEQGSPDFISDDSESESEISHETDDPSHKKETIQTQQDFSDIHRESEDQAENDMDSVSDSHFHIDTDDNDEQEHEISMNATASVQNDVDIENDESDSFFDSEFKDEPSYIMDEENESEKTDKTFAYPYHTDSHKQEQSYATVDNENTNFTGDMDETSHFMEFTVEEHKIQQEPSMPEDTVTGWNKDISDNETEITEHITEHTTDKFFFEHDIPQTTGEHSNSSLPHQPEADINITDVYKEPDTTKSKLSDVSLLSHHQTSDIGTGNDDFSTSLESKKTDIPYHDAGQTAFSDITTTNTKLYEQTHHIETNPQTKGNVERKDIYTIHPVPSAQEEFTEKAKQNEKDSSYIPVYPHGSSFGEKKSDIYPVHNVNHHTEKTDSSYDNINSSYGFTRDEMTERVRESESNRNLYTSHDRNSKTAQNVLRTVDSHKKTAARDDEYIQGQKKQLEYDENARIIFAYKAIKQDNIIWTENFIKGIEDNKYTGLERAMQQNGYHAFRNTDKIKETVDVLKSQMEKSGINTAAFTLTTKNGMGTLNMQNFVMNHKQQFQMMYKTDSVNELIKLASQSKDMLKAGEKFEIERQLQHKRTPSAIFGKALSKMGDEADGFRILIQAKQAVHATQEAIFQISNLRMNLKHKQMQYKMLKYQQEIATQSSIIHKNDDILDKMADTAQKKKMQQKNEAYQKHIAQLEKRKAKRAENLEKLNNRQSAMRQERLDKNMRGIARKENRLNELQKRLQANQNKNFHGPMKSVQQKLNSFHSQQMNNSLIKQRQALEKKKAKRDAKKKALQTVNDKVKNSKIAVAAGKFASKADKVLAPVKSLMKLRELFAALLKKILLLLGKFVLIAILVLIGVYIVAAIVASIYAVLISVMPSLQPGFNNTSTTTAMETDYGQIYLKLSEAEKTWVEELKKVGRKNFKTMDFDDCDDIFDWDSTLNSVDDGGLYTGYSFEDNQIKADPYGLGEDYAGVIEQVDGGSYATFYNVNNQSSLSNIKDIMCLMSTYYDDGFTDYRYEGKTKGDDILIAWNDFKTSWSRGISEMKNSIFQIINDIFGTNINMSQYKDYTQTFAAEQYALTLFEATHDAKASFFGIEILPTQSDADNDTIDTANAGNGFIDGTRVLCTQQYGCTTPSGLFYYSSNGNLHIDSMIGLYATDDGRQLKDIIHTKDASNNYEWTKCYTLKDDDSRNNSPCWYSTSEQVDYEVTVVDRNAAGQVIGSHQETRTKTIIIWHFDCQGHQGSYCCGHVVIQTSGIIHGIPTDMASGRETAHEDYERQYNHRHTWIEDEVTIGNIKSTDDIFAVDSKIDHNFVPTTWNGWTTEKVDYALSRYTQDWQELYGFSPETSIPSAYTDNVIGMSQGAGNGYYGQTIYSSEDINTWIKKIKESYTISSTVEERLRLGLSYVGKAAYDQGYHGSRFAENGGSSYTASDCSGFASNVWYNELGGRIMSCFYLDEWGKQNGKRKPMSAGLEPGDIILSMNNKYGGGKSNHAMVYLGTFDGEIWCVECTASNNGGIFTMARGNSWYTRSGDNGAQIMYYLDMTP